MSDNKSSSSEWNLLWQQLAEGMALNPGRDYRYKVIISQIKKMNLNPEHILDIGCGTGQLLKVLQSEFRNTLLTGLDVSTEGLKKAKKLVPSAKFDNILLESGAPKINSIISKANVVIVSEVLEHLDNPEITLEWLKEFIDSESLVIITVPAGPMSYFDKFIGHRMHYSKSDLSLMLNNCGFENFKIFRAGFPGLSVIRFGSIVRGKKIISDLSNSNSLSLLPRVALVFSKFLLKFSFTDSPLGWQLVAVIKLKPKK
jgi:2-polyprenyl-3-methyl-5-hydroxy-6-metoxy-1,4-benzoquinol methylase